MIAARLPRAGRLTPCGPSSADIFQNRRRAGLTAATLAAAPPGRVFYQAADDRASQAILDVTKGHYVTLGQ